MALLIIEFICSNKSWRLTFNLLFINKLNIKLNSSKLLFNRINFLALYPLHKDWIKIILLTFAINFFFDIIFFFFLWTTGDLVFFSLLFSFILSSDESFSKNFSFSFSLLLATIKSITLFFLMSSFFLNLIFLSLSCLTSLKSLFELFLFSGKSKLNFSGFFFFFTRDLWLFGDFFIIFLDILEDKGASDFLSFSSNIVFDCSLNLFSSLRFSSSSFSWKVL